MRLSMGKVVHASQKLACCIDICCEKSRQNINLTFHTNSEPYDIGDWSGLTWAVKTKPFDSNSDGSSDNSDQLKNTIRADIRVH